MQRAMFNELIIKKTFETIQDLSTNKGHEYSGEDDALSNFKRNAERVGITPMQVWAVFAGKHYDSICTYIKESMSQEKRVLTEPIDGRIDDLITYLLLLKGLIHDNDNISINTQYPPGMSLILDQRSKII